MAIPDRRIQQKILRRVRALTGDPEKQSKALIGELSGYRSLRAAGGRYRVIFRVDGELVIVYVVALGIRRQGDKHDIYSLARKLVRVGLVEYKPEK